MVASTRHDTFSTEPNPQRVDHLFMTSSLPPPATASSALPVGTRLGEFEITGVLGEGGFGIVYSAHDASLDRKVAIKEYLPSALSFRDSRATVQIKSAEHKQTFAAGLASFVNEARLLAGFSNPALVEVFRFWEANGTAYMAMRYYPGATLQAMLQATPQVATEAWLRRTLDPVLLALGELHQQQYYHRDISPDNIMVLPDGRSVLMDFGAARRIIGGMSQAVTAVLKPGYAPIEQYAHDGTMHQGAWTDVYAVGGVLYQAMTGQTPVQAIARMATDPLVAVEQLSRLAYSDQLCGCVMKSMAVLPANRFQSIQALRAALGWAQAFAPASGTPPAFDAQATAMSGRAVSARPAAASTFDPLATVVPARPAPKAAPGVGAGSQPAAPASAGPDVGAVSKPNAALWAGLAAAGLTLAAGLTYFLGQPSGPPSDPSSPLASAPRAPPVPAPIEPVTPAVVPTVTAPPAAPPTITPTPAEPTAAATAPSTPPSVIAPASVVPPSGNPEAQALANPASPAASEPPALPTTGVLRFELKDGWATVFVNGDEKGVAPPVVSLKLPPGSYEVELRNPALPTVKRAIKVVAGKTAIVRHSFAKEPSVAPSPTSAKPVTTY